DAPHEHARWGDRRWPHIRLLPAELSFPGYLRWSRRGWSTQGAGSPRRAAQWPPDGSGLWLVTSGQNSLPCDWRRESGKLPPIFSYGRFDTPNPPLSLKIFCGEQLARASSPIFLV